MLLLLSSPGGAAVLSRHYYNAYHRWHQSNQLVWYSTRSDSWTVNMGCQGCQGCQGYHQCNTRDRDSGSLHGDIVEQTTWFVHAHTHTHTFIYVYTPWNYWNATTVRDVYVYVMNANTDMCLLQGFLAFYVHNHYYWIEICLGSLRSVLSQLAWLQCAVIQIKAGSKSWGCESGVN